MPKCSARQCQGSHSRNACTKYAARIARRSPERIESDLWIPGKEHRATALRRVPSRWLSDRIGRDRGSLSPFGKRSHGTKRYALAINWSDRHAVRASDASKRSLRSVLTRSNQHPDRKHPREPTPAQGLPAPCSCMLNYSRLVGMPVTPLRRRH
jgi:hypothetical protein